MTASRSSIVWGGIGIALVVLAPIVTFVITPALTKLPGDTDVKIAYAGKATLVNATALQKGDAAHVLEQNVPVTLNREVKVTSTSGDSAIVQDAVTMHAGSAAIPSVHEYAVDRSSMRASASTKFGVEGVPRCLAIVFPLHPKANSNYRLYDSATKTCYPVKYQNEATVGGRSAYRYVVEETGALKDAKTLATLPKALPKSTLAALAPLLPAAIRQRVAAALGSLADPVPLSYVSMKKITVWADAQTGIAMNEALSQQVLVGLTIQGRVVPLVPVLAVGAKMTAASSRSLVNRANSSGRLLTLFETVIPVVLAVIGVALIAWAILRYRRRAGGGDAGSEPPAAAVQPVGTGRLG